MLSRTKSSYHAATKSRYLAADYCISAQFDGSMVFFVADRDGERIFQTEPRFSDAPDSEGRADKSLAGCREFCDKNSFSAEESSRISHEVEMWHHEVVRLMLL